MHKGGDSGREWWRGTSVYQIYPRSFSDSNGDGIGDLPGIISKLDYIKETGFETIWISPFFRSPQRDFGYDVSDYFSVSPDYGTDEDIDRLIREIHERDMYIIFDMVLNHTSDQHPWFIESRSSKNNPKRDWYIWKDGRNGPGDSRHPPNNWQSQTGGSGWHWDDRSGQWYWAAFLPFQPDLNYRNPLVKKAVFSMLRHWLERGVDGYRLDIIGSIFEDEEFRDSPFICKLFPDEENDGMMFRSTRMTQNLPESIDFVKELRKLTESYGNPPRFMVGETFGPPEKVAEFCSGGGLHSAFTFKCTTVPFTAAAFRKMLEEYDGIFSEPMLPVWAFSNHDRTRRISALGGDIRKAKLNALFQITARGIPFFYYGEEIGITDTKLPHRRSKDPVSFPFRRLPGFLFGFINSKVSGSLNRDMVRTPMHWSTEPNSGFCPAGVEPWLPANPEFRYKNVMHAAEESDSLYRCIKSLLRLRAGSEALKFGSLEIIDPRLLPEQVLGFRRRSMETRTILLNFGGKACTADPAAIGIEGYRVLASTETGDPGTEKHADVGAEQLELMAFEGVVL